MQIVIHPRLSTNQIEHPKLPKIPLSSNRGKPEKTQIETKIAPHKQTTEKCSHEQTIA